MEHPGSGGLGRSASALKVSARDQPNPTVNGLTHRWIVEAKSRDRPRKPEWRRAWPACRPGVGGGSASWRSPSDRPDWRETRAAGQKPAHASTSEQAGRRRKPGEQQPPGRHEGRQEHAGGATMVPASARDHGRGSGSGRRGQGGAAVGVWVDIWTSLPLVVVARPNSREKKPGGRSRPGGPGSAGRAVRRPAPARAAAAAPESALPHLRQVTKDDT